MVWYFIGVYILVWKIFHEWAQQTSEIFFNTEEKFRISMRPCNILYLFWFNLKMDFTCNTYTLFELSLLKAITLSFVLTQGQLLYSAWLVIKIIIYVTSDCIKLIYLHVQRKDGPGLPQFIGIGKILWRNWGLLAVWSFLQLFFENKPEN